MALKRLSLRPAHGARLAKYARQIDIADAVAGNAQVTMPYPI
jgi:hypothetical protein